MLGQVTDLLMICRGVFGRHCNRVVWKATPDCIMRTIGRERNRWILRMKSNLYARYEEYFFLRSLFEYCTSIGGVSCGSIVDILDHMSVCL